MRNYYDEIKPVLNKLSELNVFDSLDVVRKYVYATLFRKGKESIHGVESPQSFSIELYYADFLIMNSIIYSSIVRGKKSLTKADVRDSICTPIVELQRRVNHNRMIPHPSVWVSSYFFNQINMQPDGNEKIMLYRQFYLYNEQNVRMVIEDELGFPLVNFFRMLFFLYACFANNFCHPTKSLFLYNSSEEDPDVKALNYIISITSKPIVELREICKDDTRYDEDRIMGYYKDSPHVQFPLISFEEKLYCVIPAYILFSAFDNLYQILNKHDEIRNSFAKSFEKYIGQIFNHYFLNGKIQMLPELKYKKGKREYLTSDWILWDHTDICFVDCKIKKITISGQRTNSIDNEWINKVINEKPFANKQFEKLSQDMKESLTRDIINLGRDLGKIFVRYDDYKNNNIREFPYMPDKKFHACLLTLDQNFCNADEIRNSIIGIAQSYRDYRTKEVTCIKDDEVLIISSREMERYIPLIAKIGISKFVELKQSGDIYGYEEDNVFLKQMCKSTFLDDLMTDINKRVGNMNPN